MDEWGGERAFDVEEAWIDGWDCTVVFDDEVVGGLEWERLDLLRENLADSEGIIEVLRASTDPKAKTTPPETFIDDQLVRELVQKGAYR